jgi:hypothetical protein
MKIIILVTIILASGIFSQETQQNFTVRKLNNIKPTEEILQIEKKMIEAKKEGRITDVITLQKQLDKITGRSITVTAKANQTEVIQAPPVLQDNMIPGISQVGTQSGIKALATCTEDSGSTAGRLWIVHSFSHGPGDGLIYYNSTNNGVSWNTYLQVNFPSGVRVSADELDIEFISNGSQRFIYAVYGYIDAAGDWLVGMEIVNASTPTPSAANYTLTWPGNSTVNYYYKPRICSDNAHFQSNAFLYIICNFDTTVTGGYYSGGRTAAIYDPYSLAPTINYSNNLFMGSTVYRGPYYYDLAYYYNGGNDSIIVVETAFTDSHTVYLAKSSISTFNTASTIFNSMPGANNRAKTHGYIASNGRYNKLIVVCREKYTSTLWDIRFYNSSNGPHSWTNGYVDGRFVNKSRPEITGRRNVQGSFYCAYSTIGSYDSVFYATTTNYNWNTYVGPVNSLSANVTTALPKPGYKKTASDNCLTVWASGTGVYATHGCGAITIGIQQNGTNIPSSYELKQNYPNPFNPVTNIEFSLPKGGIVKLIVYDILGKEVSTLINQDMKAGMYKADWDASVYPSGIYFYNITSEGFSETKKMVLVK